MNQYGESISVIPNHRMADKVFLIRGVKDRFNYDMAEFYSRETRILNQAVNRDRD